MFVGGFILLPHQLDRRNILNKYEEDYLVSLGKYEFNDLTEDTRYYDQELSELVGNFKISEE